MHADRSLHEDFFVAGPGRLLGDMTASPTCFTGSSGRRLGHFAVDTCTSAAAGATDCTNQQDQCNRDHKPLVLGLSCSTPAVAADVSVGRPGHPLPKMCIGMVA